MLGTLLVIGLGSLGQFPAYYAFTQELSVRQMGKITGALSFLTWISTALVQELIGRWIDRTGSYSAVTRLAGLLPVLGLLALLVLWNQGGRSAMRLLNNGTFLNYIINRRALSVLHQSARSKSVERKNSMSEALIMVGFVVAWIVLNRWVLPRFGVAT